MKKKNESPKTCTYCQKQPLCKAYWEMVTALQSFARIDTTDGKAYQQILGIMGEACKHYEEVHDEGK